VIDLGGLVVRDVDAMVLPDEALSENLLGLSFLSKLKRFEYANDNWCSSSKVSRLPICRNYRLEGLNPAFRYARAFAKPAALPLAFS